MHRKSSVPPCLSKMNALRCRLGCYNAMFGFPSNCLNRDHSSHVCFPLHQIESMWIHTRLVYVSQPSLRCMQSATRVVSSINASTFPTKIMLYRSLVLSVLLYGCERIRLAAGQYPSRTSGTSPVNRQTSQVIMVRPRLSP